MTLIRMTGGWEDCSAGCARDLPSMRAGRIGSVLVCDVCGTRWECVAGAEERSYTHPARYRSTIGRFWHPSRPAGKLRPEKGDVERKKCRSYGELKKELDKRLGRE